MSPFRALSQLALSLAMPLTSACALETSDLVGTWKVDGDALWDGMKSRPEFASVPAEQQGMIKGAMLSRLGAMVWTFTPDGATVSGMNGVKTLEKPKSWTSTGPKTATVVPENEKKGSVTLELKDDGKLYITPQATDQRQKMVIVMKRVPADEAKAAAATTAHAAPAAP